MRFCSALALILGAVSAVAAQDPLPNTQALTRQGDIAEQLVAGVDKFLLRKLQEAPQARTAYWQELTANGKERDLTAARERLKHILGVRDARRPVTGLQLIATTNRDSVVAANQQVRVQAVRWPVFEDVYGQGYLLEPVSAPVVASVVWLGDADQSPEALLGFVESADANPAILDLVASGVRVVVPTLISRHMERRNGRALLSHREYVYRSAFELGRHIIGYELQKVMAVVDWYAGQEDAAPIGVAGYGEGGMLALYAAAVDPRIDVTLVSGHFAPRENIWQQPISRNVFGLLNQFGDAELAAMISPRSLIIDICRGPETQLPGSGGGAPAELRSPSTQSVKSELTRLQGLRGVVTPPEWQPHVHSSRDGQGPALSTTVVAQLAAQLVPSWQPAQAGTLNVSAAHNSKTVERVQREQIRQLDQFTQRLLRESPFVRKEYFNELDTKSVGRFKETIETYRHRFRHEVIGHFSDPLLPARPRTRLVKETAAYTMWEVVLDVYPDVIAYGLLLLPRGMGTEKRPVVVCQHGLEGRPRDIVEGDHRAYHDFAAKLAERGFITFAPQNLYIFRDKFRTLQRKANPLQKTLFSIIVPQHQQIVNWLSTLPNVDKERIAFYGLSYGGKSAMRIPALVPEYCLSICSADFNEWVRKNASTRHRFSYVWTGEYEIFEFDLGSTFNYAEMAALICPRPFMVERGHFDGVGTDEWVAYEFAKVRNLYQARLGIGDRCEIEWFVGPHTINGKGTFDFLHKHLNWPRR